MGLSLFPYSSGRPGKFTQMLDKVTRDLSVMALGTGDTGMVRKLLLLCMSEKCQYHFYKELWYFELSNKPPVSVNLPN